MGGGSESKKQLGKILLQQKLVSVDELQEMLEDQKREPGSRLASSPRRAGRLSMKDALRALSEQHDVPGIDLTEQVVALAMLRLIPAEIAHERCVFPLRVEGDVLLLAMSSPDENDLVDEIEFITAKKIQRCVALDGVVRRVVDLRLRRAGTRPRVLRRRARHRGPAHQPRVAQPAACPRAAVGLSRARRARARARVGSRRRPQSPSRRTRPRSRRTRCVRRRPPPTLSEAPVMDQAFGQRIHPSGAPESHALDPGTRALLAVSDSGLCAAIEQALLQAGVSALSASDGRTALELIRDEPPALLVLDLSLRSLHALDVGRRLRASQRFAELPIVALGDGGWRMGEDLREGFAIEHFFEPPFELPRLARTVRLLLEGQPVLDEPPPLTGEPETRWTEAMQAFERGDLETAIVQLEGAAALAPDAFELQYHLGLLYGRCDDLFAAMAALEAAVRLQRPSLRRDQESRDRVSARRVQAQVARCLGARERRRARRRNAYEHQTTHGKSAVRPPRERARTIGGRALPG